MKVKKIIKTVITVLAVFIAVIIIKNPDKALATQTGEDDVYAELTDVQLDDSHSINIYAHTHVSYAYDEGAYGWIVDGYVVGNGWAFCPPRTDGHRRSSGRWSSSPHPKMPSRGRPWRACAGPPPGRATG